MKIIAIFSGGLDSTVLLHELVKCGADVRALSFNYGQRHAHELDAAAGVCLDLGLEHRVADIRSLQPLLAGSSLTSNDVAVPLGHYAQDSMKATVVPNRNMIMLSIAAGWAISLRADAVAYAAHGGDHAIYPDCRPEFAEAVDRAVQLCDWHKVRLLRPFVALSKAEIVARGAQLGVPFERTWSCYQGSARHCGMCGTCVERREAFYLSGTPDPTEYEPGAPTVESMVKNNWRLAV